MSDRIMRSKRIDELPCLLTVRVADADRMPICYCEATMTADSGAIGDVYGLAVSSLLASLSESIEKMRRVGGDAEAREGISAFERRMRRGPQLVVIDGWAPKAAERSRPEEMEI